MRKYAWRGIIIFALLEIVFRIVVNPVYIYYVNPYTIDKTSFSFKRSYFQKKIKKIDYLFIGESRTDAAINVNEITRRENTLVAINAGRGYSTGAIHYWALKKIIRDDPGILIGSKVIIEVAGGINYTENFEKTKYTLKEDFVHLILPHINFRVLMDFIKFSDCKPSAKLKLVLLYSSSIYRTLPFVKDKLHEVVSKLGNKNTLRDGVGTKAGNLSVEEARKLLIETSRENIEMQQSMSPLTNHELDNSMLSKINDLIVSSGGRLYLLEMPMHSIQKAVYETTLNRKNKETITYWARQKNIDIIYVDDFIYSDDDFPDYWHLGGSRSTEFTAKVINKISLIDSVQ